MVLTGAVCGCTTSSVMLLNPRRLTMCLIPHRYVLCPVSIIASCLSQITCCGTLSAQDTWAVIKQTLFIPCTENCFLKKALKIYSPSFTWVSTLCFIYIYISCTLSEASHNPWGYVLLSPVQNCHRTLKKLKIIFCQSFGIRSHFLYLHFELLFAYSSFILF